VHDAQHEEYTYGYDHTGGLTQTSGILSSPFLLPLPDEVDEEVDEKGMHKDVKSDLGGQSHLFGSVHVILKKVLIVVLLH
jgi:hypothetical protein